MGKLCNNDTKILSTAGSEVKNEFSNLTFKTCAAISHYFTVDVYDNPHIVAIS